MRVRQWAVVGAAFVAAWAGGAGVASATPMESDGGCQLPPLLRSNETDGLPPIPDTCGVEVWVTVDGDCEDPETFTFNVAAEGLEPGGAYALLAYSDDILGADGEPTGVVFDLEADENGDVEESFPVAEDADFQAPSAGFVVEYELVTDVDAYEPTLVQDGTYTLEACEAETTPTPTPTHPSGQPVESAHPTTSAPATTTPAAVVVHPVAQQPVLANTGTPTAAIALVGGGLLVAGGGALVATRRRA